MPNFAKLKELPQQGYRDFKWSSFEEASKAAQDGVITYNNSQYRISKSQFDRALVVSDKQKKIIDVASVIGTKMPTMLTPNDNSKDITYTQNLKDSGVKLKYVFDAFKAGGTDELRQNFEKNFGETRLFNATQNQFIERKLGEYHLQSERNFGKIENDLSRVENSLGRLIDNHHNAAMMEMLKMNSGLEKSIANSELTIVKQAADNYAAVQIEAAKNKLGLEQKLTEISGDIKLSNLKDNNDTRALINSYNNDNMRFDLHSEKIIHALHHHGHHRGHYDHHRDHHHYYNNNFDRRRDGSRGRRDD
jgi:hypothetical protein